MMREAGAQSGFSLIEIVVVCVLAGVFAGLAVPRLTGIVERGRAEEGRQLLSQVYGAQMRFWQEHNHTYPADLTAIDIDLRGNSHFKNLTLFADSVCRCQSAITRSDGSYTLTIDRAGVITCSGGRCGDIGLN